MKPSTNIMISIIDYEDFNGDLRGQTILSFDVFVQALVFDPTSVISRFLIIKIIFIK